MKAVDMVAEIRQRYNIQHVTAMALFLLNQIWFKRTGKSIWQHITSAYRDPAYQKELQERWDSGNRAGLVVRPADQSRHTLGYAFDLGGFTYNELRELAQIWRSFGHQFRWGGDFRSPDYVHFDIRA